MFTQVRAIIVSAIVLVLLLLAGLIYWRGSSNANAKNDLRIARETIKLERQELKITNTIGARVNTETLETQTKAQGAVREIANLIQRNKQFQHTPGTGAPGAETVTAQPLDHGGVEGTFQCDATCTRVMQLAREARAAAVASAARLQPADAGAR